APASFTELDLSRPVLQALSDLGYETPTPVQATVIPLMRSGLDLIVQARTGTGKTAAFGIPLAERFASGELGVVALVVTPTRELALQVAAEIDALGRHKGIRTATVYGGVAHRPQVRTIERAQVVVGTPGRLLDHLRRGSLSLGKVQVCILDEADEMLSMGFLEDVEAILQHLPAQRQFLLASATIPQEVLNLSQRYMTAPEFVSLSSDAIAAEQVQHTYYLVLGKSRLHALVRIIRDEEPQNAIVFCNTRADSALVCSFLRGQGFDAEVINGDLPQSEREKIMNRCKEGNLRFMVATDVAARGIDISGLSHVINFQLPEQIEMYIHRTGRTGRAGKSGKAISLISPQEMGTFYFLRMTYDLAMVFKELPAEEESTDPFAAALVRELEKEQRLAAGGERREPPGTDAGRTRAAGPRGGGRREERTEHVPRPERRRELRRGDDAPAAPPASSASDQEPRRVRQRAGRQEGRRADGREKAAAGGRRRTAAEGDRVAGRGGPGGSEPRERRRSAGNRSAQAGMVRLHLNAGTSLFPGGEQELRTELANHALLPENLFGRIDLHASFSFVEVPENEAGALLERMQSREVKGVPLRIERSRPIRGER
ncbi:MAG: DEAD/DEAH box helicase, partial [Deltaproteobacteria bacterium]|nr:DEAD/DEAH box helicase [Deltaproteobacteria bacterium]